MENEIPQENTPPAPQPTPPPTPAVNSHNSNTTSSIITVLLLIFVFPIGLIVMWFWPKWKIWIKILITIIGMLGILIFLLNILLTTYPFALLPINDREKTNPVITKILDTIIIAKYISPINPAEQSKRADNAKRESDITAIANTITTYKETNNILPPGISNNPQVISKTELDLCPILISTYLVRVPIDPSYNQPPITDCSTNYITGYTVQSNVDGTITVSAPNAGLDEEISVTR